MPPVAKVGFELVLGQRIFRPLVGEPYFQLAHLAATQKTNSMAGR
jgi:hypothetical protein